MSEQRYEYTTNIGDYLIIWITGCIGRYIAQVTNSDPLQVKVQESGPYASLRDGDFIIQEADTEQFQRDCREDTNVILESGREFISGLESLGVTDNKLRHILPG